MFYIPKLRVLASPMVDYNSESLVIFHWSRKTSQTGEISVQNTIKCGESTHLESSMQIATSLYSRKHPEDYIATRVYSTQITLVSCSEACRMDAKMEHTQELLLDTTSYRRIRICAFWDIKIHPSYSKDITTFVIL